MKVLKFGGTSVGSAQRMKEVSRLITEDNETKIVVLSAMSGTTNSLLEISDYLYKRNPAGAIDKIAALEKKYEATVNELYTKDEFKAKGMAIIAERFYTLREIASSTRIFSSIEERIVVAQGELISTALVNNYLLEQGVNSVLLAALDFMRTDKNAEPDMAYIKENIQKTLDANKGKQIYITQGFICKNSYNEIDNLQRGGSDYTASIIGAVLKADEIQIWTDIDGMHNNDPRFVENTKPVASLHFEEAAELAYFGAKILHPTCVLPAKQANVPVKLLNTMEPKAKGTTISTDFIEHQIKAVAAKDGITAIKIKSGHMLLAFGFLRKIFEIFEHYKTPIDMITTSEVGVSVTVDNTKKLDEIVDELRKLGTVSVEKDMVIICVVGDMRQENVGFQAKVVNALKDIPVRMISYGGSNYNVSLLVKAEDKINALKALSKDLF
ncbi:MAG: aspartate kinase [Paludibacteraceae bacterium]|nr:aspartate kinase [Paludibacteraceae bacterium]MBQ7748226.1 aspartate kinase [Paludibacteraceae bacterium]MBR0498322.1 aspartate kinase [Paludibacteraceae bacterium]